MTELVDGHALLADGVVLHLHLGAVSVSGLGEAIVRVVFVAGRDGLRLAVDGAGDGLGGVLTLCCCSFDWSEDCVPGH